MADIKEIKVVPGWETPFQLKETAYAYGGDQRKAAEKALQYLEIPTRKWENWKYTRVKPLFNQNYIQQLPLQLESIEPYQIPGIQADMLVFLNGVYAPQLSSIQYNHKSLSVQSLSELDDKNAEVFESYFGQVQKADEHIFAAMNTAYATEGVFIQVKAGKVAEFPIHILHISDAQEASLGMQHRNLFLAGRNSQATVIESYHSLSNGLSFRNQVTEIVVEANANFNYTKLQQEGEVSSQVDTTHVHQYASSHFTINTFTFSGKLVRNNLEIDLLGKGSDTYMRGLYAPKGKQHIDNHTIINHKMPHCYSDELYKGVLSDNSTGAFSGKIHVWQDAQKTNAFQSNHNILLSDSATMNTKPQLEIYADDVKCSHGSTTGQINEEALFYLRARGIKEADAKVLMMFAFAGETLDQLPNESLKEHVSHLLERKLQQ